MRKVSKISLLFQEIYLSKGTIISLIISKEIDISIKDDIIYDISNYLSKVKPFNISVSGIEDNGNNVVWIRFKENEY